MNIGTPKARIDLQGDTVLVVMDGDEFIFTIVHLVGDETRELQLVNRGSKERPTFTLTQAMADNMVRISHKDAKWKLTI